MSPARRTLAAAALVTPLFAFAPDARAADGVLEISQAQAVAGGVTENDDPGFPVTLSETGSYVLTGNLTVPDAETDAIEVRARNVTIDLNGFTILGPTNCNVGVTTTCANPGSGRAIYNAVPAWLGTTVKNGKIRGVGGDAITLSFAAWVENVQITSCGGTGIAVSNHATVLTTSIRGNGGDGISAGQGSAVTGNTVSSNVGDGIVTTAFGNVSANTITGNMQVGIRTHPASGEALREVTMWVETREVAMAIAAGQLKARTMPWGGANRDWTPRPI